jgi:hypothetical protein
MNLIKRSNSLTNEEFIQYLHSDPKIMGKLTNYVKYSFQLYCETMSINYRHENEFKDINFIITLKSDSNALNSLKQLIPIGNLTRGDLINIRNEHEFYDEYSYLIYDGQNILPLDSKTDSGMIPSQFSVITEFPLHY